MKLASPAFEDKQTIPAKYTCKGENISPPLTISDVPVGAKSLTLIMHDPDAVNGDWVHWVVWDIPPQTVDILENSKPAPGVEGITSFNSTGYGGPCPPAGTGTHRYIFELYALDTQLDLLPAVDRDQLKDAMYNHIIEQTELVGHFSADQ